MPKPSKKKDMRPPFPVENIALNVIDLDLRNSRFPRDAQSQSEALELMLLTSGDECLDLLRDLTRTGQMNSSDLPIVIKRDSRYLMMEGNRRLTCLRLWENPEILTASARLEEQFLSRVKKMVNDSSYSPPNELRVVIAPTEPDADKWIERKHAGGFGGRGTVEWGAAMKDRRRARNDPSKTSRAMAFVELVSREYGECGNVQAALETVRSKRYTMIHRFVDKSAVRDKLGLQFDAGYMSFRYGADSTFPIIHAVLSDFAQSHAKSGKSWARELDTTDDFLQYLDQYSDLLPEKLDSADLSGSLQQYDRTESGGRVVKSDDSAKGLGSGRQSIPSRVQGEASQGEEPTRGEDLRPPRPTPPRNYILQKLVLDKFTPRVQEIARQTSNLSVTKYSEIVPIMLRVLLELTVCQFLKSHGKDNGNKLDKRIRDAIKLIEPNASNPLGLAENTSPLQKAFHSTTADSIRLLQYTLHDGFASRTPSEVIILADRYLPVFQAMNDKMGDKPVQ